MTSRQDKARLNRIAVALRAQVAKAHETNNFSTLTDANINKLTNGISAAFNESFRNGNGKQSRKQSRKQSIKQSIKQSRKRQKRRSKRR